MNPNFAYPCAKTKSVKPCVAAVTKRVTDTAATAVMMLIIGTSNLSVMGVCVHMIIFKDVIE